MTTRVKKKSESLEQENVSLIPIMNLVCLLIPFLLYTASFVVFATIDVRAQRAVPAPVDDPPPELSLNLIITDQGFRVASESEALPASCGAPATASGSNVHIPLSADGQTCSDGHGYPSANDRADRRSLRLGPPACAYDFSQLEQCMTDLKASYPAQDQLVISGEPGVDYDVLIHAMDASRGTEENPLFPDVALSAGLG